jgi:hypothetical protein
MSLKSKIFNLFQAELKVFKVQNLADIFHNIQYSHINEAFSFTNTNLCQLILILILMLVWARVVSMRECWTVNLFLITCVLMKSSRRAKQLYGRT